jgi:hypothetical protein
MIIVEPIAITDAALLASNVSETLYPPYDPGYVFAQGDRVSVVGPETHQVYESLIDGNMGNTPSTSPTKWIYVSTTNPWLMFDLSVTSQTINEDSIEVTIQASGRVSCIALMNISALEAHVVMTDAIDGVFYDQTHSLVSTFGINNWHDYFFNPVVRLQDLILTDLPLYTSPIVTVTLSAPGEAVKCGAFILGQGITVGDTLFGASVGIQDFSVKQQNEFGDYFIVKRAFRKIGSFPVRVKAQRVDMLQNLLARRRSTPTLYVGTGEYASTTILGFFKEVSTTLNYPTESDLSIEIEGLT